MSELYSRAIIVWVCVMSSVMWAAPIQRAAAQTARATSARQLGPGDEVLILIPERGELQEVEATIDATGEVALGLYGRVNLNGLTEAQARDAVARQLSKVLASTAGVQVILQVSRVLVMVTGNVRSPGPKRLEPPATIWAAVQQSGGALEGADLREIVILRGDTRQVVNVHAYLTGAQDSLPALERGDTIFVPAQPGMSPVSIVGSANEFLSEDALATKIFVMGAVKAPGIYERAPGMTALTAIGLARGPLPLSDLSHVRVISKDSSARADVGAWMAGQGRALPSLPDDGGVIVYVPSQDGDPARGFANTVMVVGAVRDAGHHGVDGSITLIDAIARAGGPDDKANLRRVRRVRRGDGFTLATVYDLERYSRQGGVVGEVEVAPGDLVMIGSREETTWRTTMQVISDVAVIGAAFALFASMVSGG